MTDEQRELLEGMFSLNYLIMYVGRHGFTRVTNISGRLAKLRSGHHITMDEVSANDFVVFQPLNLRDPVALAEVKKQLIEKGIIDDPSTGQPPT